MDNNFLLTYSYENSEGMYSEGYKWFQDEEEMKEEIEFFKEIYKYFKVNEAFEIINVREIELE